MKIMKSVLLPALLAALLAFAGCENVATSDENGHNDSAEMNDHGHAHAAGERPTVAVTQWTGRMELFMEYPEMVANEPGRFIIHLTVLDGFQPVREGEVKLRFTSRDGQSYVFTSDELLREGIFAPTVELRDVGPQEFVLSYEGPGLSDSFTIDDFTVYPSAAQIPQTEEGSSDGEITFLKEQQWKIPFATADVEQREIRWGTWAVAEVMPRPDSYADIVSPVAGIVHVRQSVAAPGASVGQGNLLATIEPPVLGEGWTSARLSYEQAKQDYERAQRLLDRDAISQREFEEIRTRYLTLKAGIEAANGSGNANSFELTSPFAGHVIDWQVQPGQLVRAGQKLMAVVDPGTVWLRADVYEDDFPKLGEITGAYVKTGGPSVGIAVDADDLAVVSRGGTFNPRTRTVPVLLEVANRDGRLRMGERVPVELYSSDGSLYPSVPESAVFDDNGMDVVFVQPGGESFEKRPVALGPTHMGYVAILNGLNAGERVVTRGGYQVKLASSSTDIGHGHAH